MLKLFSLLLVAVLLLELQVVFQEGLVYCRLTIFYTLLEIQQVGFAHEHHFLLNLHQV